MKTSMLAVGLVVNGALAAAVRFDSQLAEMSQYFFAFFGGGVGFGIYCFKFGSDTSKGIALQTFASIGVAVVFGPTLSWMCAEWMGLPHNAMSVISMSAMLGIGGLHFIGSWGPRILDAVGMGVLKHVKDKLPSDEKDNVQQ